MSSIQGIQGLGASVLPSKLQAVPPQAAKSESGESAQTERAEAARGAQEVGEAPSAQGANSFVGSKFSGMA